jgi:hypothetical protein
MTLFEGKKLRLKEDLCDFPNEMAEVLHYNPDTKKWNIWVDGNWSTWKTEAEAELDFEEVE